MDILEKEFKGGPGPSKDQQDLMRWSCRVMDANAFETPQPHNEDHGETPSPSLRGLYPLAAMMNHACSPNTTHVFGKAHHMVVRAAVPIRAGEELTNSYTTLLWGTLARRRHLLATKHFLCRCERCKDPQEWGAKLSALACPRLNCLGSMLPTDPLQLYPTWQCDVCEAQLSGKQAAVVQMALGKLLVNVDTSRPEDIHQFLSSHSRIVPASNQVVVQLKCDLICLYGHRKGHLYTELPVHTLEQKKCLCEEMLQLLATLRTGQCNLKGLICYELACTLNEMKARLCTSADSSVPNAQQYEVLCMEARSMLDQSAVIFQGDVTAPAGLGKLLQEATSQSQT